MNAKKKLNRRDFLKAAAAATGALTLAGCAPQVVKETVIVEKPVEKMVKETVIVEGTPQVVEKVVTATPVAEEIKLMVSNIAWENLIMEERTEFVREKYPNVTFEVDEGAVSTEDEIRFLARLAAGTVPDTNQGGDAGPSFYGPRGIFIDLATYMNRDKDFWFDPNIFEQRAFNKEPNGAIYGIPHTADARQIMLNLQSFEDMDVEVPPMLYGDPNYDAKWSWEDMKETARQLTVDANGRRPGDAGFDKDDIEKYGLSIDLSWLYLWPMIYQAGGKVVDDEWKRVYFDSDEAIKAMKYVQGMVDEGIVPPPALTSQLGGGLALISSGATAMNFNGAWTSRRYREEVGKGDFRLSFAPFPHDVAPATLCLGIQMTIPTLCKYPEIAYEWLKGLYVLLDLVIERWTTENPEDNPFNLYRNKVDVPLTDHYKCFGKDCVDLLPILGDAYEHAAIMPKPYGPWFPEVRDLFQTEMGPALNGEIAVEDAVEALMPQAQEIMDRWYEELHQ